MIFEETQTTPNMHDDEMLDVGAGLESHKPWKFQDAFSPSVGLNPVIGEDLDCGSIVDLFSDEDFYRMVHDMEMSHILSDDVYPYSFMDEGVLEARQGVDAGKDWSTYSVQQLRGILKRRGLSMLGRKPALVKRLEKHSRGETGTCMSLAEEENNSNNNLERKGRIVEIKVDTTRAPLDDEKTQVDSHAQGVSVERGDSQSNPTVADLRQELKAVGLSTAGKKVDLAKRLREYHARMDQKKKSRTSKKSGELPEGRRGRYTRRNRSPTPPPPPASGSRQKSARKMTRSSRNRTSTSNQARGCDSKRSGSKNVTRQSSRKCQESCEMKQRDPSPLKPPVWAYREKENLTSSSKRDMLARSMSSLGYPVQPFKQLSSLQEPQHLFLKSTFGVDLIAYPPIEEPCRPCSREMI